MVNIRESQEEEKKKKEARVSNTIVQSLKDEP